ncbi:vWA domain-containing protein [Modestobacter sp. VKM Ac-2982]|uniref:vWA domain-containing protein n=1 Tax=Modestobacter sp. VKM Ac-2982 TaxID=3004136 RepID=UPI0022AA32A8|nr:MULTISPECIES: vWA domain-containing protein [unclassified Modestobacter]MCZ2826061.1 VWA domain-containing protein [Modestobacter sp. VKM Ac-2981]MCZ2852874.1 VWA domain-containing protein [Modestobacter sp. VKM Ac-2982]
MVCLDVSGSMYGYPLSQAVLGCERFVDEALEGHYAVAMLFWHHAVAGSTGLTRDRGELVRFLRTATAGGGNNIVPTLDRSRALLQDLAGDRVIAIFGDGDLGDPGAATARAAQLQAENIRIITCGLGQASAESLDVISTESGGAGPRVAAVDDIADSIAGMSSGLRRRGRS